MTNWSYPPKTSTENSLGLESGFAILLENGSEILVEDTSMLWSSPDRNTATWSETSKPTSYFYFKIDDTYSFLIDDTYQLIIDSGSQPYWSYPTKN